MPFFLFTHAIKNCPRTINTAYNEPKGVRRTEMKDLHILGEEEREADKTALSNYKVRLVMIENVVLRREYMKMESTAIKYAAVAAASLIMNVVLLWCLRG